jgi:hypothetical protein
MPDLRPLGIAAIVAALMVLAMAGAAGVGMTSLQANPLSALPFQGRGLAALQHGDMTRARLLLTEAVRRDPHALAPHVALVMQAAQAGDLPRVGERLTDVARLDPAVAAGMAQDLAGHAPGPDEAAALGKAMGASPVLAAAALTGMGGAGRDGAVVSAFLEALPPGILRKADVRRAAATQMVRLHDFSRGRAFWPGPAWIGPVYSPNFSDLDAPPPFGWQVQAGDAGVAERDGRGGVSLSAYGRTDGVLIEQLLTLAPGPWRVELDYEGQSAQGGVLVLRLRCAEDGRMLGARPLDGGEGKRTLGFSARVPADHCGGQWLDVAARAMEGEAHQDVLAIQVRVKR